MKTRTKITVTLAVGIGLLIGSMGVASASPHYSDFKGGTSFKAPVSSYTEVEWTLKASVRGNNRGEWVVEAPVSSYREDGAGRLHENGNATSVWTNGNATSLENRSGLHDSVHAYCTGYCLFDNPGHAYEIQKVKVQRH